MYNTMSQEFRTIENFPNYKVSNFGYVQNILTSEILIPVIDKKGDALITIQNDKTKYTTYVKKIVAEAFVLDLDPTKLFILNLDKNKSNNHFLNLIWIDYPPKEVPKNNTSGCIGVQKRGKKWIAVLTVDYHVIQLGTFSNKNDAILARRNAELKYHI